jgi:hypothetical protein
MLVLENFTHYSACIKYLYLKITYGEISSFFFAILRALTITSRAVTNREHSMTGSRRTARTHVYACNWASAEHVADSCQHGTMIYPCIDQSFTYHYYNDGTD